MRKYYLDNIRWSTVSLVVIYHVIYMFNGVIPVGVAGSFKPVQYQDAAQYILYPWFMVLLFIVSGMCAKYYLDSHTEREFLRSKTVKLLVPSTVGLFVFQWIQGIVNMKLGGAFDEMGDVPEPVLYLITAVSGTGVLWYIQLLWLFSVLLLLICRVEKGRLYNLCGKFAGSPLFILLLGAAVWGASRILNTPVVLVYRFGIYGFSFLIGYFVFSHDKATDCLVKYRFFTLSAAVASGTAYTVMYFGRNYAESPVVNCLSASVYLWFACLTIIGIFKKYADKENKFTRFMNRKSWGIYVFHYLPVSVCGLTLKSSVLPPVLIYIVTAASAFAGAMLLYEIISRIPVLRWCVLGINSKKGKEKCSVKIL